MNSRFLTVRPFQLAAGCVLAAAWLAPDSAIAADSLRQLIPQPVRVEKSDGVFRIRAGTVLHYRQEAAVSSAGLLHLYIKEATGQVVPVSASSGKGADGSISLSLDHTNLNAEAYRLEITPETVHLSASGPEGLVNGVQTIRQLLSVESTLPCGVIEDAPRFGWRGLMLDCSRTFQSVDYLKKTIDRMAFYKLNVLHLHLTDDQGWRMEIRAYPELTQKGAHFAKRWNEPPENEGYYTQEQLKELVAYASARNITIVPEIELPGHTLAVLACYPDLSCTGAGFEITPYLKGTRIHKDIFCAGNDEVFRFLDDVIEEVCEIFPSEYIHIGGDEAPKNRWKECPECQARIRAEKLSDEAELQSWFIGKASGMLEKRGRKLIGWDEILEGGLPPGAAVMSWRGTKGGVTAARAGHPVVMSPTSHCYFDYTYERTDTRRVYGFDPLAGLKGANAANVLGIQANFWSHIDREPAKVDAQLFPRLLALAERAWVPDSSRDWNGFAERVKAHRVQLDNFGIAHYPDPLEPASNGK